MSPQLRDAYDIGKLLNNDLWNRERICYDSKIIKLKLPFCSQLIYFSQKLVNEFIHIF